MWKTIFYLEFFIAVIFQVITFFHLFVYHKNIILNYKNFEFSKLICVIILTVGMRSKSRIILILFFVCFFIVSQFTNLEAANKKRKVKKHKHTATNVIKVSKETLMQPLYEYFPLYEQWERAEVYPYSDIEFLNNYDKSSVFEDYYLRIKLMDRINDWLGTRYKRPGRSRNGVDCSNFVSIIIQETLGKIITAGAASQAELFKRIDRIEDLQFGDLIFFTGQNKRSKRIGHVGIYINNGLFAHSSTRRGVVYSHITEGSYIQRFRCGGRIHKEDLVLINK